MITLLRCYFSQTISLQKWVSIFESKCAIFKNFENYFWFIQPHRKSNGRIFIIFGVLSEALSIVQKFKCFVFWNCNIKPSILLPFCTQDAFLTDCRNGLGLQNRFCSFCKIACLLPILSFLYRVSLNLKSLFF